MGLAKTLASGPVTMSGLLCLIPLACSHSASDRSPGSAGATATAGAANVPSLGGASGALTAGSGAPGSAGGPAGGGATSGGGAGANGGATSASASAGSGGTTSVGGANAGGAAGTAGGAAACAAPTVSLTGADAVLGKLIRFNEDGGWCWYQDERALVDTKSGKLIVGSVAKGGAIEAVIYDLAGATKKKYTLGTSLTQHVDDHNAPALLIRPDGKYFAMWSGHRVDCITRTAIFDGTAWSAEAEFDWKPAGCPWPGKDTNMVTYSNPWYIGTSIYAAVRSVGADPAVLTSSNDGQTLSYYGRLMSTEPKGYVAGYFKYWGDNTGRIDFVATEAHPRDFDTSLYHGYIEDGRVFNSKGELRDPSLKDMNATNTNSVDINTYTPVFQAGATIGGVALNHAWNHDIVRYADGTIAVLGQARVVGSGSDDPDKRMLYFRFDGTWKATYLAKAGIKLYGSEQDYTGLGALVPDDPTTIYISTPYDPSTDKMAASGKREIWRGTTCDHGASFKWTPVTANSTKDNIRPIVPKWDSSHTALLWMQGAYTSAQDYTMAIVGTISGQ